MDSGDFIQLVTCACTGLVLQARVGDLWRHQNKDTNAPPDAQDRDLFLELLLPWLPFGACWVAAGLHAGNLLLGIALGITAVWLVPGIELRERRRARRERQQEQEEAARHSREAYLEQRYELWEAEEERRQAAERRTP
jgi:hypothetical protein